jgi:predicted acetyltransferase
MGEPNGENAEVAVSAAVPADALLIQNLAQLYTHDFSEFWAGTPRGDVDVQGRFPAYPLDPYWSRQNWSAAVIWCNRQVGGFALINDETHSGVPAHRNMGEFFILRKYRGRGLGRIAAEFIFSQHPGSWEVAVARKNSRAWDFWVRTVRAARMASSVQELDVKNSGWNGPILRFEWNNI